MKISAYCEQVLKSYESLELAAYVCPAGKLTIGWGHTGKVDGAKIHKGLSITKDKAQELFEEDIETVEAPLSKEPYADNLSDDRWDALVSLIFNLGWGKYRGSTLRKKLLCNVNDATIPNEFRRWVYGTDPKTGAKIKLPGLVKRREWEAQMYEDL